MRRKFLLVAVLMLILALGFTTLAKTTKYEFENGVVGPIVIKGIDWAKVDMKVQNGSGMVNVKTPVYENHTEIDGTVRLKEAANSGEIYQELPSLDGKFSSKTVGDNALVDVIAITDNGVVKNKVKFSEVELGKITLMVKAKGEKGWIIIEDSRRVKEPGNYLASIEGLLARRLGISIDKARDLRRKYGEIRARLALEQGDTLFKFWELLKGVKIVLTVKDNKAFAKIFHPNGEELKGLHPTISVIRDKEGGGKKAIYMFSASYREEYNAYVVDFDKRIGWLMPKENVLEGDVTVMLTKTGFDNKSLPCVFTSEDRVVEKEQGNDLLFNFNPKAPGGFRISVVNSSKQKDKLNGTVTVVKNDKPYGTFKIPEINIEPGEEKRGTVHWDRVFEKRPGPGDYMMVINVEATERRYLYSVGFKFN